jgi:hypothetical protein
MANDDNNRSRLPVLLKDVDKNYDKPERRNDLVPAEKYDTVDKLAGNAVKLGTNGVAYVPEDVFPTIFGLTKPKAAYVYENQIPDSDKRDFNGQPYAHSASVVGLLDKKAQEVRNADTQAILQYSRDTLLNISDSPQAQELRRQCDTFTKRELPKLRAARGADNDELIDEPLRKGAAFHHVNPKEIHTDPEDALNPDKGRNVNSDSHGEVHRENINDEKQFDAYKNSKKRSKA